MVDARQLAERAAPPPPAHKKGPGEVRRSGSLVQRSPRRPKALQYCRNLKSPGLCLQQAGGVVNTAEFMRLQCAASFLACAADSDSGGLASCAGAVLHTGMAPTMALPVASAQAERDRPRNLRPCSAAPQAPDRDLEGISFRPVPLGHAAGRTRSPPSGSAGPRTGIQSRPSMIDPA